jgi:hypothetical protein
MSYLRDRMAEFLAALRRESVDVKVKLHLVSWFLNPVLAQQSSTLKTFYFLRLLRPIAMFAYYYYTLLYFFCDHAGRQIGLYWRLVCLHLLPSDALCTFVYTCCLVTHCVLYVCLHLLPSDALCTCVYTCCPETHCVLYVCLHLLPNDALCT